MKKLRRLWCWWVGHSWVEMKEANKYYERRCSRCGKFQYDTHPIGVSIWTTNRGEYRPKAPEFCGDYDYMRDRQFRPPYIGRE